jgi:thiosulfate/3-mercaptopyruvate sulfurtransferase
MSTSSAPFLLSPAQLQALSPGTRGVSVLDASWVMPNSPRKPSAEFLAKRIPGAQYIDLDAVASSHELGLKHMMPDGRVFADVCGRFLIHTPEGLG